jgi:outer membrane receptor protein involved in Fe transport
MSNDRFRGASSWLRAALITSAVVSAIASAQQAESPAGEAVELEQVVVTGSRIARENLDAPTPVTTISAEELLATGTTSIGDTLNDLPALRGTFTSANSTRFIGTAGVNFLDLRGLGSERTLVLVNGRRHVSGTDGSLQVDINTIPQDLLQRVDIITGGASSIYGSDAVAGVVNFVTKTDFEGFQIRGQTGLSSRSDNQNSTISLTAGLNFAEGHGNIAGSLEWTKEDAFKQADRPSTRQRDQFVVQALDPMGTNSDGTPDRLFFQDVRSVNLTEGGTFIPAFQVIPMGSSAPTGALLTNGQPRLFRFNPDGSLTESNYGSRDFRPLAANSVGGDGTSLRRYGDLTPEREIAMLNLLASYEVTDSFRLFGEAKYVHFDVVSETSPSFNQTVNTAAPASTGSGALVIRLDNPYLSTQARGVITPLLLPGATSFNLNRNNLDLGIRGEDTLRETTRFVVGARGDITENLRYEVSLNYGELKVDQNVLGNRFERQLRLSVDAARAADGSIVCRSRLNTAGAVITTGDPIIDSCVPVNVLGDGNVSDAARAYITAPSTFEAKLEQQVANAYVSYNTGSFFELPGGPIGFSVGAEYRKESTESEYSTDVSSGLTFLNAIQPLAAEYSVKEAFAEVSFPLLNELPFVRELSLNGAIRFADYDLQNTSTVKAWTGSLTWAPIEDVRIRASLSTSVRAPTLGDLFQPLTQNFATVRDPCDVNNINSGTSTRAANCAAAGIPVGFINTVARAQTIEIRSGGNSGLTEEQSRSLTAGVVLEPRFAPGLSMSFDYFDIDIEDVIASVTAQQILDNCYDAASLNNIFCPLIFRDPATNLFYANGNGPIGGGLLQSTLNYASRRAVGVDAEIRYRYDWESVGRFDARLTGTWTKQRDNFPFLSEPARPDQILEELGDPEIAWNFDLGFKRGRFSAAYGMRWLDSQYVDFIENVREVGGRPPTDPDFSDPAFTGSVAYHDVRFAFDVKDNVNVYVGIDNIGDQLPPLGFTGTGGGSGVYSNRGRYFYGGVKWDLGAK